MARRSSEEPAASDGARTQGEYPDDAKSSSADSSSTIRPQIAQTAPSTVTQMTAGEHVAKGIECHENGSLQESTYHLRIAAKMSHPTGMLLYALACRHGWGMRPNQREGVQWLRKAMDSAQLEIVDDESQAGSKGWAERKARQAQFALSIYELGVSHLNGWGIEQDKALALRCFEIAGKWGDPDALAEAGYCYADGIGCKKDLKKAAKYYRMAEAKGMNMVGNSWYVLIHCPD
jgi:TPR repeat protein